MYWHFEWDAYSILIVLFWGGLAVVFAFLAWMEFGEMRKTQRRVNEIIKGLNEARERRDG